MTVVDTVLEVHEVLDAAGVAHAFGGAIALEYIAEPRGTVDVDVNVFVEPTNLEVVMAPLAARRYAPENDQWVPVSGIRVRRAGDPVPVDLFPSVDPAYTAIRDRSEFHPFGPDHVPIPVLCAEDLTVFKLSFGRDKDWVDLRRITQARPDLDADQIEQLLIALRGPTMYPRLARLRAMLDDARRQAER